MPLILVTDFTPGAARWEDASSIVPGAPGAWQTIDTFANGWSAGANGYTPAYRLNGDTVQLRGNIDAGMMGMTAFTLAEGFRPLAEVRISISAFGDGIETSFFNGSMIVNTDGTVYFGVPDGFFLATLWIDCTCFTLSA